MPRTRRKTGVLLETMEHGDDAEDEANGGGEPEPEAHEEDVLAAAALSGVDLPEVTRTALSTTGVPRELRLPDWPGPVLFHSELGGGRLVSSSEEGALVRRTGMNQGYLFGSVRDAASGTGTGAGKIYSVFCLRRGVGDVVLLDVAKAEDDRFVNSSLAAFLTSMNAFATGWAHFATDGSEKGDAVVASFRALLTKLDPRALANAEHYWPGWLEELE